MNIYLFGKTSLSGEAFYKLFKLKNIKMNIYPFSRKDKDCYEVNLKEPRSFSLINNEQFKIISFAPIWELSYCINYLFHKDRKKLKNLTGIIACSSTSALTKRFESNSFDKNLSSTLIRSEKNLIKVAEELKISCQIIRPTMIYGSINGFEDRNISRILLIMNSLKFILLPSNSGMRQPIHAAQLAEVFFYLIIKSNDTKNKVNCEIINVGGDDILNYAEMIENLKTHKNAKNNVKNCFVIKIPNRLFLIGITPIIFFSPKTFAAFSRICANLSGFKKACEITKTIPIKFPYPEELK